MLFSKGSPTTSEHWDWPSNVLAVKLPPFTPADAVDRSTFIRAPINITTPTGLGIATATVQFGYLEQGTGTDFFCTSRRETCVAVASTVTDATPFWFEILCHILYDHSAGAAIAHRALASGVLRCRRVVRPIRSLGRGCRRQHPMKPMEWKQKGAGQ
jgi:hypothetical protein